MIFEMYKKNSNQIYMTIVINGLGALAVEIKTNHKSNIFSTSEARFSLQLSLSIQVEDMGCVIHPR